MLSKNTNRNVGFTIVEVIVIVVIIGILASLTIVAYNGWRKNTAETSVKSDLTGAASAMENARNFSQGYPTSLPSSIIASLDVTLTYATGDATKYCIDGAHKTITTVKFFIDSTISKTIPQNGTC